MILTLLLLVLFTFRLTHLLTDDAILDTPREWLIAHTGGLHGWGYVWQCSWCMGLWVASGVSLTAYLWPVFRWDLLYPMHGVEYVLLAGALSTTTVFLEASVSRLIGDD